MKDQIAAQGKLKNGATFIIRYPRRGDVQLVWEYGNKLSKEKTYIRFQGEEITLEEEKEYIQKKLKEVADKKSVVLFLIIDGKIHGICNIELSDKTESHVARLGLSVDQTVRGQGLGKKLLLTSIEEAKRKLKELRIIRLEVKHPNTTAINLYKRVGFIQYGHLPEGSSHRGELVDELFMYIKVK